jgi:hypothetical protein
MQIQQRQGNNATAGQPQKQGAASGAPTSKKIKPTKTTIAATQINKTPFSRKREKGWG